ncbi:hypothetical protein BDZ97DRAFT_1795567 [Flammula alnicola]|nr:hypothetical protein BDZ97DRAFT_1795567 [Flammula alnicola]
MRHVSRIENLFPLRSMQVTIALLPVSLSLVHIPRSRLDSLSHPILRQLLHPNPAFLNITCNEIELSIFAEHHILQDFEPVARKDRHRQRSRSGSGSSKKSTSHSAPPYEPVEISYEKWSVLQIDSHSDQIDKSGTRVYDLSAPLAAAGISILYQSSYMSDFIFVKESRLQEAMDLFASAGFDLYRSDSNPPISPSYSPITDDGASANFPSHSTQNMGAVFTRNISEKNLPKTSDMTSSEAPATGQQSPRSKSHSPTSGEVRILRPDLACVGLSDELGVDHWGLKIVKLVAFPDLIPPSPRVANLRPRSASKKSTHDNLATPYSLPPVVDLTSAPLFQTHLNGGSSSSSSSSSDDDGYFSHSPQNVSTTSLTTSTSRSYSDLQSLSYNSSMYKPPSKHFAANLSPLSPITPKAQTPLPRLTVVTDATRMTAPPKTESHVPFFSFTRTPEGSSLTADVDVLATLFPPHERHMVICSGELDAADLRLQGELQGQGSYSSDEDEEGEFGDALYLHVRGSARRSRSRSSGSGNDDSNGNSLKCLQIDLRRFGLDKHGLVNRFSRVLEENGINHMYSSTFKTANLLVDKKDAVRAQSLLRSC